LGYLAPAALHNIQCSGGKTSLSDLFHKLKLDICVQHLKTQLPVIFPLIDNERKSYIYIQQHYPELVEDKMLKTQALKSKVL
jgi:hypothetical protein